MVLIAETQVEEYNTVNGEKKFYDDLKHLQVEDEPVPVEEPDAKQFIKVGFKWIEEDAKEAAVQVKEDSQLNKILWSLIGFLMSVADMALVCYLAYLHFHHASDLVAWLMLLPILFNFIGIFTFLSDDDERHEMQYLVSKRIRDFMFFPVFGPTFSALVLFVYSLQEELAEKFERLESLLIRMNQYESFFRAAPEAFIQIAFRIITWSKNDKFRPEFRLTTVCIALSIFALAESNMYGPVLRYYHLFKRVTTKDAWKIDHIGIRWRCGLFIFCFCSMGSRIFADAILKATACFYFSNYSFGEVIIVVFLFQFFFRAGTYGLYNSLLASETDKLRIHDEGFYGAFTYSWRSLFMSFDFQSRYHAVFLGFFLENFLMVGGSYVVMYLFVEEVDLNERFIYHNYAAICTIASVIPVLLRFFIWRKWQQQQNGVSSSDQP